MAISNKYITTMTKQAKQYREDATLAHLLDVDSWELVSTNLDETPQQDNGYDCGVCHDLHFKKNENDLHTFIE